jgi:hypothetical protein
LNPSNDGLERDAVRLIGQLLSFRSYSRRRAELEEELAAMGAAAVPALLRALRPAFPQVLYPLLPPYKNPTERVVRVLGRIGDYRATEALIALVVEEDNLLVEAALEALGEIGDPRAAPCLRAIVQDPAAQPPGHLYRAVVSFVPMAQHDDLQTLQRLLGNITYEQYQELKLQAAAQRAVVTRLIELGDPNSIPIILAHELTEFVTVEGLSSFGPPAIPVLVEALEGDYLDADKALAAIIKVGRCARPLLRQEASAPPGERGSRCAIALCFLGEPDLTHVPAIVLAIERSWARPLAIKALAAVTSRSAAPELRCALPVLRKLTRQWQMAGKVGLKHPQLDRCVELLERIEQQTAEISSLPVVASSDLGMSRELPVAVDAQEMEN